MKAWRSDDPATVAGLRLVDLPTPKPGLGELLVRVDAAALNYADLLMITGRYQVRPERPFTPGQEIAGTVVESATGAATQPGERIASKVIWGGFAEFALVRDDMAIPVPASIDPRVAAALPVVYVTAVVALCETASVGPGDWVLVFAPTGGVGIATLQVAKSLGARVIAVASGEAKHAVAREEGADVVVESGADDIVAQVMAATEGRGVGYVVDTVGGAATALGLKCLAWRGEILIVGFLSGEIPEIAAHRLLLKGASARGVYWDHDRDRALVARSTARVLALAEAGAIRPRIDARYRLADLPRALEALSQRRSVGKLVLTP